MMRSLRWFLVMAALTVAAGLAFGLGEAPTNSSLLNPELPFERGGMGVQQGTQVYNQATGRIESLFGMADGPYQSAPEVAALEYLGKHIVETGYSPGELSLLRSVESQGCRFVTYEANVSGLPVFPGETVVSFDQQMRVVFLFNGLLPVDRHINTAMRIADDHAIQLARGYLKVSGKEQMPPVVRAVLWAGDDRPRPAWIVTIVAESPRGDWQVFVDGNSGEIFRIRNNEKNYNGHGMAFTPDPLTTGSAVYGSTGYLDNSDANSTQLQAQRFPVTLRDITYSGGTYSLVGPWVTLLNFETPAGNPVTSTDSNGFSFTRDAQGFEDVMCYYHLDTSQRWIQSLGFTNIQHGSIVCDPHGLSGDDNSHFIPSTNRIAFGEGGVDDDEDADVIWHEYGHAIQNSIVSGYGASHDEGSMGEGFGDYWAASYSKTISDFANTWVFNWDGHNPYWDGRVLNANYTYSAQGGNEIHDAGQIWSQACYDTRNRANVGRTVMDKVVLQHHFGLGTTATMLTAAAAILTADNTLYGGIHYPDIYAGFVPRGLLSSSGAISCTAPNGAESWTTGTTQTISWSYYNLTGNVRIEINRSYSGGTWEVINNTTALSAGSYSWTVTGPGTTTARVRVSPVSNSAINDVSNANFTIVASGPSLVLTAPNGGENWYLGDVNTITWTSLNLPENVKIELNRSYPGATWEVLNASAPNSGTYAWTVTGPVTAAARVRISGTTLTSISDTSNANFTIAARSLTVTSPNGADNWAVGSLQSVNWSSANLTGTVNVELNRSYPAGSWESIAAGISNSGSYVWTVTGPATGSARVRLRSVSYPSITDMSDANFTIYVINQPPSISHDPLHDQGLVAFTVTAIVIDDAPGFVTKFFYRPTGAGLFDSLTLAATGNANEFAVSAGPLAAGQYDYSLRVTDSGNLSVATPEYKFWVGADCGSEQAFDDGTSERSNWSENTDFRWAVKFDAPTIPYFVCTARIAVSSNHPDTGHSRLKVDLVLADGPGGLPGTTIASRVAGSIGNEVGGVNMNADNWVTVYLRDNSGMLPVVNSAYYIAVSNLDSSGYEAFLQDTTSALASRSYVWDPCDSTWHSESLTDSVARRGNRMIRSSGYGLVTPTALVIQFSGDDMRLDWTDVGAAYYRIYSSATAGGPYATYEGTATTNSFIDVGAASGTIKFYEVHASTTP